MSEKKSGGMIKLGAVNPKVQVLSCILNVDAVSVAFNKLRENWKN